MKLQQLSLTLPIKVISEANSPEHWRQKRRRKKAQQAEVDIELLRAMNRRQFLLPCRVRLVRIGPRRLDPDNLANAFKGIQDAVAARLGVDDGDINNVRWVYDQEPIKKRQYAVRVEITTTATPPPLPIED